MAILGFRAVGKSSLTNSFVTGTFSEAYDPTIESTHHKTIRFRKVHFATDIVDTAGMVRNGKMELRLERIENKQMLFFFKDFYIDLLYLHSYFLTFFWLG